MLRPARRLLPPLGGLDLSPMLVMIAIVLVQMALPVPAACRLRAHLLSPAPGAGTGATWCCGCRSSRAPAATNSPGVLRRPGQDPPHGRAPVDGAANRQLIAFAGRGVRRSETAGGPGQRRRRARQAAFASRRRCSCRRACRPATTGLIYNS
ncbi:MAG: YggT family protein [Chromatiales bacterium]|nr:YggT family protein [Chromatiales bacterium]